MNDKQRVVRDKISCDKNQTTVLQEAKAKGSPFNFRYLPLADYPIVATEDGGKIIM